MKRLLFLCCAIATLASCSVVNINISSTPCDPYARVERRFFSEDGVEIVIKGIEKDIKDFHVGELNKNILLERGYKMTTDRTSGVVNFVHAEWY